MFLSELKLYHTCFTYHLFKFRNKYIKIFSNNMWRISTEIKQTKTSSCCFSFLKNVLCMDRKQQCLFSVCLMNVSQERKQQCLLKPQFILKKINVGLLASKKTMLWCQQNTCGCFQRVLTCLPKLILRSFVKILPNEFLCKTSIHHYGPNLPLWIIVHTDLIQQELKIIPNKFWLVRICG